MHALARRMELASRTVNHSLDRARTKPKFRELARG